MTAEELILSSARAAVATVGDDRFFHATMDSVNHVGPALTDLLQDDDQPGFCLPAQIEDGGSWVDGGLVLVLRRATLVVWTPVGEKYNRHLILNVVHGDQVIEVERIKRTWRLPGRIHLRLDGPPGANITVPDVGGMESTLDLVRGFLDGDVLLDF